MSDMFDLPSGNVQRDVFNAMFGSGVFWQPWTKPRGCSFVSIFAMGGGGSGGGGLTGTTGAARGGGSGGGSAATMNALFPAAVLPDTLYVMVGLGGAASGNNTIGNAGSGSYVEILPSSGSVPANNLVLAFGGGAGQKGTTTAATAGIAGAAGIVATYSVLAQLAIGWISLPGQAGGAGGTGATTGGAGGAVTCMVALTSGGAGGGGVGSSDTTANAGGNITGAGLFPTVTGGVGHAADATINGMCGSSLLQPYCSTGGSGGGCNGDATVQSGLAGAGGDAGYGSGGGGGGGGITGASGGKGGNGIVIITSW